MLPSAWEVQKVAGYNSVHCTRHSTENSKQILPEKELCCHSPKFPHSCVCGAMYCIYFLEQSVYSAAGKYTVCGPILGLYKSLKNI
jgi:hypothetical protein